jgi:hypothetical protein
MPVEILELLRDYLDFPARTYLYLAGFTPAGNSCSNFPAFFRYFKPTEQMKWGPPVNQMKWGPPGDQIIWDIADPFSDSRIFFIFCSCLFMSILTCPRKKFNLSLIGQNKDT